MIKISNKKPIIRLFASDKNWIEGEALKQLGKTAELEGMELAAGMPDLHPGRGNPVGAAFITRGVFYPYLVGNDVGCGMGVYQTTLKARKMKRDKWARKLNGLETPWEGDVSGWLEEKGLSPSLSDSALGSIGGGNHFAELQVVEKVFQPEEFKALGLDKSRLVLLVHSGSRGIGEALLRRHTERHGAGGLAEDSEEARAYLEEHDHALKWAVVNRALIAHRFASQIG
ncbi:MAG: RNA ligase RtcB family protein, partial [Desulfobacterales bacterium]|nr:RNA ligase RtcB family protein [Desulfobacterales bacterium]